MEKRVKVIADSKYWIRKRDIGNLKQVKEFTSRYERHIFREQICARCPNLEYRYNEVCEKCTLGGHEAFLKLWQEKTIKNKEYIGIPSGWHERIERLLNKPITIVDKRANVPFSVPIRFTGRLYAGELDPDGRPRPNQVQVVQDFMVRKSGIIKVPPRGGKTVMSMNVMCQLAQKTLIIAHQKELLLQFYKTIMGSKEDKRPPMTNVPYLQKKHGKTFCKIIEKISDLKNEDLQIVLINYQKLIRKEGPARVKALINGNYGLVIVDEVHRSGALEFSKFLNSLDTKYKMGLSATVARKDSRHIITRDIMGPIAAETNVSAFIPLIRFIQGPVRKGYPIKSWPSIMKWIKTTSAFTDLIVKLVFDYAEKGHKSIIIPVDHKDHQKTIADAINAEARRRRVRLKEKWPTLMADTFHSGSKREQVLKAVDRGEIPVLVAIRSMVKEGIDFQLPTVLIMPIPMSAKQGIGAPLFHQLSNRVSTRVPGKQQPELAIIVPGMPIPAGMIKGLWSKEIEPGSHGKNPKYLVDKTTLRQVNSILLGKR